MQDAFGIVVFVVVILAAVVAVAGMAARNRAYDEIGRGDLSLDRLPPSPGSPSRAELEAEVRALVSARNARRQRRGQPPLDVEAEVQRELAALRTW